MEAVTVNQNVVKFMDLHKDYLDEKIERDIEEYRKGLFALKIVRQDGTVPENIKVRIHQKTHEFRFGAPPFLLGQLDEMEDKYRTAFLEICNYAVLPLYWDTLEPEKGKPRFRTDSPKIHRRPPVQTVLDFCEENDLRIKGHCLIYNAFQPEWIPEDHRELKISIDRRLKEIADCCGNRMEAADVINELYAIYKNCYKGNRVRNLSLTDEEDHEYWAFDVAKKYFPYTRLFWNEGCLQTLGPLTYYGNRSIYHMMLQKELAKGTKIEGIGIQYHAYSAEEEKLKFICNPLRLIDAADCYGSFRLPIHLSEVSVASWEETTAAEQAQADILSRLYRIFFSRPSVESIIYWNLVDKSAYGNENKYLSGLLHPDLSHKIGFDVISDLINNEWRTDLELSPAEIMYFKGFYGKYEVEIDDGIRTVKEEIRLFKEDTGFDNRLGDVRCKTIVLN